MMDAETAVSRIQVFLDFLVWRADFRTQMRLASPMFASEILLKLSYACFTTRC